MNSERVLGSSENSPVSEPGAPEVEPCQVGRLVGVGKDTGGGIIDLGRPVRRLVHQIVGTTGDQDAAVRQSDSGMKSPRHVHRSCRSEALSHGIEDLGAVEVDHWTSVDGESTGEQDSAIGEPGSGVRETLGNH